MIQRGIRGAAHHISCRGNQTAGADDVDDDSAFALRHPRHRRARHPHVAEKLQLEIELPVVIGDFLKITRARAAGIVYQDVDAAEFLNSLDRRRFRLPPGR